MSLAIMESQSLPVNVNESLLKPWFQVDSEVRADQSRDDIRDLLTTHGLIEIEERTFVKCTHEDDHDYFDLPADNRDCSGKIYIDPEEEKPLNGGLACPECGRGLVTVKEENSVTGERLKKHFTEYRMEPNWWGIWEHVQDRLEEFPVVASVDRVSPSTRYGRYDTSVQLKDGGTVRVVLADRAEAEPLYEGLFFGTPTLYIQVSPYAKSEDTLLAPKQILPLTQLLTTSNGQLSSIVQEAALPLEAERDYDVLDEALDCKLKLAAEENNGKEWQYFEQHLIPELNKYIADHPSKAIKYLETLKKLDGTIFNKYHVPVGGSGATDVEVFSKTEVMKTLLEGNFLSEAKRYDPKSDSSIDDDNLKTVSKHLLRSGSDAEGVVFYCTTNDVKAGVWDDVMQIRGNDGEWTVIIVTRHLLLELIDGIEAHHLLEVEVDEDGSLRPFHKNRSS